VCAERIKAFAKLMGVSEKEMEDDNVRIDFKTT
jgi:hypothetical protein